MKDTEEKIQSQYHENKETVNARLKSFESLKDSGNDRKFKELVFVILTSQSDPIDCWRATNELETKDLLKDPSKIQIIDVLEKYEISFPKQKQEYIVNNKKKLSQPTLTDPSSSLKINSRIKPESIKKTRNELAEDFSGLGMKGASHFLRNVGYVEELAIISRPILATLYDLNLVESTDPPETRKDYLRLEERLEDLSGSTGIKLGALDLVLWSMENEKIFK